MIFNYISVSNTGLQREINEDNLGVFEIDGGLLVIVCDGLGGNSGGEVASALAVETIYKEFKKLSKLSTLERIEKSILNASEKIITEGKKNAETLGMATTSEVVFIKKDNLFWGHVGDSRIYLIRKAKLQQLSKDHSLVQRLVDEGYITMKEAERHPNKNIITRALGDNEKLEIDTSKIKLKKGEGNSIFVCSDGVTGVLSNNEIENIINTTNLSDVTDIMSNLIDERGAPDNYSFVLLVEA